MATQGHYPTPNLAVSLAHFRIDTSQQPHDLAGQVCDGPWLAIRRRQWCARRVRGRRQLVAAVTAAATGRGPPARLAIGPATVTGTHVSFADRDEKLVAEMLQVS